MAAQEYQRFVGRGHLPHTTPRVRRAFDYWDSKRQGRLMPARADIDPTEIRDLLSGIVLVDVTHDPLELTYRLVGTDEVEARGYDPTGRNVRDHVFAATPEQGFLTYRLAIDHRDVVFDQEPFASPNPRLSEVASVIMPLSNDGEVINMLMAFVDYRRHRS